LTIYDNRPFAVFTADPNPCACGATVTLDASDSHHGRPDRAIVSYHWDLDNDGQYDDATGVTATRTFTAYGSYPVGLRVTDNNDPAKTAESFFDVLVNQGNQPPEADAGGPYDVDEGHGLTLDGSSSSDPNASCGDDIVSWTWDLDGDGFDDGLGEQLVLTPQAMLDLGLGDGPAERTIRLRVTDSFGASDEDETTIVVNNVPPVATAGAEPRSGLEPLEVTFTGADSDVPGDLPLSYSWSFGDGQTSNEQNPTHTYLESGTYTATVTVTDEDGDSGTDSVTITVENAPPVVTVPSVSPHVDEGSPFQLPVTFTDPGVLDTHVATIDWGDGTAEDGTVVEPTGTEPGRIEGTHVYGDDGTYRVRVYVRDDDMTDPDWWVESFFDVFVDNVLPSDVDVQLNDPTIFEGQSVTLNGTFVDPGTADTHVVTVNWGDGDSSTVTLAAGVTEFTAVHVYLDNETETAASDFPISVSVVDDDFLPPVTEEPEADNFQFSQLSWYDAGATTATFPNSSWGMFTVDVVGDPNQTLYLNVAADAGGDTAWIVQNMPIFADLTNEGGDFDISLLGVQPGTQLTTLNYIATVDNGIRTTMPTGTMTTATVAALDYYPGSDATLGLPALPADVGRPAGIIINTLVSNVIEHEGVPGVQEGVNQCLAGATARSIAWLNARYNLGSPKSAQEIYEDTKGLNTGSYEQRLAAIAAYLSNLAAASGATASTKVLTAPGINVGNPAGVTLVTGQDMKQWIRDELNRGEDVTLDYDTHIVTVTGTFDVGGKTFLKFRDDENQRTNAFGDAGTKMGELSQDGDGNWQFRPADSNSFFQVRLAMSESVYRGVVTVTNLPPAVSATNDGPVDAGTSVNVTITATDPAGVLDEPLVYEWDWNGDGTYDALSTTSHVASHTYDVAGEYTVGVQVTDHDGDWATDSTTVTVYLNEPEAAFTAAPNPCACNATVTFDASTSTHGRPDRAIVQYEWDFDGDGTYDRTSTTRTTTYAYPTFGTYNATLQVTDNNDPAKTDTATVAISVSLGNLPPVARPGGPYLIQENQNLPLDGSASSDPNAACGDRVVSYEWDLRNDGTFEYTGATPTVPWTDLSGLPRNVDIPLALRVTDEFGLTHTATTTLNIRANRAPTDIVLSPNWVLENTPGAIVGNVTVTDPDLGDTHTLAVLAPEDARFEIVGGQLKLKAGVSLDRATEPIVTLQITATDAGGLSYTEEFTIAVLDPSAAADTWQFDFNGFHGRTALGYLGVSPWQEKSAESPYGWVGPLPWYFERYDSSNPGWDPLRYDGQSTNTSGEPVTFAVDVLAGKAYEVMILTGDPSWNHDLQQFQVWDASQTAPLELPDLTQPLSADTQVVGVWGAAAPDSTPSTWGGGTPSVSTGFYRWIRFTTGAIGDGSEADGVGTLLMKMLDRGGGNRTTVILAMSVRAVDRVAPLTLVRAQPAASGSPFSSLAADGATADQYTGAGAAPGSVLTVTVSANVPAGWPSQYAKVTVDGDWPTFGTQVQAKADGTFEFWVQRPATLTDTSLKEEDWTITVEELTGLARATAVQPYKAPNAEDSAALRFDFGATTSPVQKYGESLEKSFLQVVPQTIYSATRGYGWQTRVAAGDRRDNYTSGYPESETHNTASPLRTDFNSGRNAKFRVDLPDGLYNVRLYHSNPLYFGRVPYTTQPFQLQVGSTVYSVGAIPPGQTAFTEFSTTVSGGNLQILFGVNSTVFMIAGIDISAGGLPADKPLVATGDPQDAGAATIGLAELQAAAAEAAARWTAAGLTAPQAATLADVQYAVADLGGTYLGLANPAANTVRIDDDAAMIGWSRVAGPLSLDDGPITKDGVSLLTVVMHELGHLLGHEHSDDPNDLMAPVLSAGRIGGLPTGPGRVQAEWGLGASSLLLPASSFLPDPLSRLDAAFADLGRAEVSDEADSDDGAWPRLVSQDGDELPAATVRSAEEIAQAKVPRRSRMEQFERELDEWFAEYAAVTD